MRLALLGVLGSGELPIPDTIDWMVVAGGGSSGSGTGGGGAGGLTTGTITSFTGGVYSITVGGARQNSSGFGVTMTRGGDGGVYGVSPEGKSGGSGGGGAYYYDGGAGISGQGNDGGGGSGDTLTCGGGGGKNGVGRFGASGSGSGGGGAGYTWLDGELYAHGGRGDGSGGAASPSRANSGNGGNYDSNTGGLSGVVAFRVLEDTLPPTFSGLTTTSTTSGGYTYYYCTAGTGTVSW